MCLYLKLLQFTLTASSLTIVCIYLSLFQFPLQPVLAILCEFISTFYNSLKQPVLAILCAFILTFYSSLKQPVLSILCAFIIAFLQFTQTASAHNIVCIYLGLCTVLLNSQCSQYCVHLSQPFYSSLKQPVPAILCAFISIFLQFT